MLTDLAQHIKNDEAKARLVETTTNKDKWAQQVEAPMLGLIDILRTYHKDLDLPLDGFLQITDRLMPRYYTIASGAHKFPKEVKIAVSLESLSNGRLGQVSLYLLSKYEKPENLTSRVFIKDSMFALPADQAKTPLICVGPGTGVVPFIGFL